MLVLAIMNIHLHLSFYRKQMGEKLARSHSTMYVFTTTIRFGLFLVDCCTNTHFRRRCSSGRSLNLVGFWLVIENICTGGIADAIADANAFYRFVDIRIELMRLQ